MQDDENLLIGSTLPLKGRDCLCPLDSMDSTEFSGILKLLPSLDEFSSYRISQHYLKQCCGMFKICLYLTSCLWYY